MTSAEKAFSESERALCSKILDWRKKIIVVINKFDLLETQEEKDIVLNYVRTNVRDLLRFDPIIFPVSSRMALKAKETGNAELLKTSQFDEFENFVKITLDDETRFQMKISNVMGIVENVLQQASLSAENAANIIESDEFVIQNLHRQIGEYQKDMESDFAARLNNVENVLLRLLDRVDCFIEENMNLYQITWLFHSEGLKTAFQKEVVGDFQRDIDCRVEEIVDWILDRSERQAQASIEYASQASKKHADMIIGDTLISFEGRRKFLVQDMFYGSQEVVKRFDKNKEAAKIRSYIMMAMSSTVIVEAGAVSVGAAVLSTGAMFDITGILGASFVALAGLYILPFQRGLLKRGIKNTVNQIRGKLHIALSEKFKDELDRSVLRINDAVAPYTRFVRAEKERLNEIKSMIKTSNAALETLRLDFAKKL